MKNLLVLLLLSLSIGLSSCDLIEGVIPPDDNPLEVTFKQDTNFINQSFGLPLNNVDERLLMGFTESMHFEEEGLIRTNAEFSGGRNLDEYRYWHTNSIDNKKYLYIRLGDAPFTLLAQFEYNIVIGSHGNDARRIYYFIPIRLDGASERYLSNDAYAHIGDTLAYLPQPISIGNATNYPPWGS